MSVPTNAQGVRFDLPLLISCVQQRLIDGYTPSVPLAAVGIAVYVALSASLAWRLFSAPRKRHQWMWPGTLDAM